MLRIIVYLFCLLTALLSVKSEGELLILNSPENIQFRKGNELPVSKLKDVFSTVLGFSVEQEEPWPAVEIKSPFGFAEGILLFCVPGVTSLSSFKGKSYPLIMDEDIHNAWNDVVQRIEMRYPENKIKFEEIDLEKSVIGNKIYGMEQQNISVLDESEFLKTLGELSAAADLILKRKNKDGVPDFYVIELPNMGRISELPGRDSKELLVNKMISLSDKAELVYDGKILVAAVSEGEEAISRRLKRQAVKETPVTLADLNVADDYDEDFPVIFNIFLWLSVALIFSLIAISMVIANMDPGRDSIIYRMTSTRMKKDN